MAFWLAALIWVGITAISSILRPKPPRAITADARPEKFSGITAEEGRPIPVVWGRRQIAAANLTWYGDLSSTPIVDGGSTVGYKYFMGTQLVACIGPIDRFIDLRFNKKQIGSTITSLNNTIVFKRGADTAVQATIAEGNYGSGEALSKAVEDALNAVSATPFKVTFVLKIEAGRNNTIQFGITRAGVMEKFEAVITVFYATYPPALAQIIEDAMNFALQQAGGEVADGDFRVEWNTLPQVHSFSIVFDPGGTPGHPDVKDYESWTLFGFGGDPTFKLASTAITTLGYKLYGDKLCDASNRLTADVAVTDGTVGQYRFMIAYGAADGNLLVADAAFTAETILGLTPGVNVAIGIKLTDVNYAPTQATFTETTDYLQVDLNDPTIFGNEGGVSGRLDIYRGLATQVASSYLTTKWGSQAPGFRFLCYMVQRGMYVGNTNYPKPISVVVERCPNQVGMLFGKENVAGDSNPVAMIFELLTDNIWGLGIPAGQIDAAAFIAAGETLFAENFGMSYVIDATMSGGDVIAEIMRHIDGVVFVDQLTGFISIKLARPDYDVNAIPELTKLNVQTLKFSRTSWDETRNVVKVRYIERAKDYTERVVQRMDLANIQTRAGDMAVEEFVFPGISNQAAAEQVAERMLRSLSYPVAHIELLANREAWSLRPGSVFALTWEPLGITKLPCRVTRVATGDLVEGTIRIEAIEDIEGPAWTGFVAPTQVEDPDEILTLAPGTPASDLGLVGDVPVGTV
jgi:putative tail protein